MKDKNIALAHVGGQLHCLETVIQDYERAVQIDGAPCAAGLDHLTRALARATVAVAEAAYVLRGGVLP